MAVPFCLSVERKASRGCLGGSNSERTEAFSEAHMSDDETRLS